MAVTKTAEEMANEINEKFVSLERNIQEAKDSNASKEEIEKLETALEDQKKAFNESIEKTVSLADFEAFKKKQKEINVKQGEALAKKVKQVETIKDPLSDFETKFKEACEDAEKKGGFKKHDEIEFAFKVDNTQTFTVGDVAAAVYPGGTTANATQALFNNETSVSDRIFEAPKRKPSLLDGVRIEPIEGGQLGAVVKVSENGDAAVVNECEVKPYASLNFDIEYSKCGTIAVLWKESKKWRTSLSRLLPAVRRHMTELVQRKIERVMFDGDANLDGLKTFASAFVPNPQLLFNAPSKLEAIGATIYSMQSQEYSPTTVLVAPIDYATMVHHRAEDGHYDILNNGSIQLINGNTIISGSNTINLIVSTLVTPGEFFVGDMSEAIIGLERSIEYSQGLVNDDFERNLVTNRLEIEAALLIPTAVRGAFVNETYASVIPQITL